MTLPIRTLYLKKTNLFHLIVILLALMLVYFPVYKFNFLFGWDDQWFVLNHYTSDGFTVDNCWAILTEFYRGQYAPVNQLYYTALYQLFNYRPMGYHLSSLVLHMTNTILVYYIARRFCTRLTVRTQLKVDQGAFLAALFFSILPINLEPVAWVAASKVLLYAMFYLFAMGFYFRYLEESKPKYYYLTLVLFFISFGAKEQAVSLPVCLLLIDYLYKRDFKDRNLWLEKLPMLVLSLLFGLATIQSQTGAGGNFYDVHERFALVFYTFAEYFTKSLIPINLSYLYPFPFLVGHAMPWWLWFYPIAIPLIVYCLYRQMNRHVIFGLLFFTIHIVLVLNVISLARFSIVADRYAYVATIGLCLILANWLIDLFYVTRFKKSLVIGVSIYFLLLSGYTHLHSHVWQDVRSLKAKISETLRNRSDYKKWLINKNMK